MIIYLDKEGHHTVRNRDVLESGVVFPDGLNYI